MPDNSETKISDTVQTHDVVLFMKGTPEQPQCGFSSMVSTVLSYMGIPFQSVDVLADEKLRQAIKTFSNWPTVPQLYVKGEFVGGCDIVREMYESGELKTLFAERGISASV